MIDMDSNWIEELSPKSMHIGTGWFEKLNKVYVYKNKYVAMTRTVQTKYGEIIHCCIRNDKNTEITWKEKQWIKDSLFGEERIAIEIFPAKSRLIDEANMYHLWIFPEGYNMGFGIHELDINGNKAVTKG